VPISASIDASISASITSFRAMAAGPLRRMRRDPAQSPPKQRRWDAGIPSDASDRPAEGAQSPREAKHDADFARSDRSDQAMKFFTGLLAATALALATTLAQTQVHAQVPSSGALRVSDFEGPYGAAEAPPPRAYGYGYERGPYERGPAPTLLPPEEVYAVLRENGFSPLGIPRLRGMVYTIAAIDRRGDDGRLVIDARDGRILRFMPAFGPAFGMGPVYLEGAVSPYGPQGYGPQGALPAPIVIRGGP
jgi:hypothetical protein